MNLSHAPYIEYRNPRLLDRAEEAYESFVLDEEFIQLIRKMQAVVFESVGKLKATNWGEFASDLLTLKPQTKEQEKALADLRQYVAFNYGLYYLQQGEGELAMQQFEEIQEEKTSFPFFIEAKRWLSMLDRVGGVECNFIYQSYQKCHHDDPFLGYFIHLDPGPPKEKEEKELQRFVYAIELILSLFLEHKVSRLTYYKELDRIQRATICRAPYVYDVARKIARALFDRWIFFPSEVLREVMIPPHYMSHFGQQLKRDIQKLFIQR